MVLTLRVPAWLETAKKTIVDLLPDSHEHSLLTDSCPRQAPEIFVLAVRRPRYEPQCVVLRVILFGSRPFKDRIRPCSAVDRHLHSRDTDAASDHHVIRTTFANLHSDSEQLALCRCVIDDPLNDESRVDVRQSPATERNHSGRAQSREHHKDIAQNDVNHTAVATEPAAVGACGRRNVPR